MDAEALLPESRRFCPACDGPVGRGRDGRPGRLRGTCPWCRRAFDLRPHLDPGAELPGRSGAVWRVDGPLVRGGRAWLHTVHDPGTGRTGVLTRTRGPGGDEAGLLAVTGPEVLLALRHPGLVRVRDAVDGPGEQRHLVLDPVRVAEGPGPTPAARVLAALPAVAFLHDAGLLHADLTPEHLVATGDGGDATDDGAADVVVIDLGSVRRADDRTSPVWGTAGFVAPEITPGGAGPSPASDVWSLGRTLAVLDTGPTRPGRPSRPPADPDLARVVAAATDPDPARRPTLAALGDLLAEVVARPVRAVRGATRVAGSPSGVDMHHDGRWRHAVPGGPGGPSVSGCDGGRPRGARTT